MVYEVDDEWVAYGTWVANSDCTQLVGIEIKKSDWRPLTDWSKFRAFYFTEPECRLINIDLKTGEQRTILQRNAGSGILSTVHSTTIRWRFAMKGRAMRLTPACGLSTPMAATCAACVSTRPVRVLPTSSGCRMVPPSTTSLTKEKQPAPLPLQRLTAHAGKPPTDGDTALLPPDEQP